MAKTKRKAVVTDQVQAILDAARAISASGQEQRKHHLVPQFYLDRWAVEDRIKVTDLDTRNSYTVAPKNALYEIDFYRVGADDVVGGSPVVWETWLSTIEGEAAPVFRTLDALGVNGLTADQRGWLLFFVAVQLTRSRSNRLMGRWLHGPGYYQMWELDGPGAIAEHLKRNGHNGTPDEVASLEEYFRRVLADPWSATTPAAWEMDTALRSARGLAEAMWDRNLVIYNTVKPIVTTDEPAVLLYEHMGDDHPNDGGVLGAPIIVFPLGPRKVLAMFRANIPVTRDPSTELTWQETLDLNTVLIGNAYRQVVESPGGRQGESLRVPDRKDPVRIVNLKNQDGKEMMWTPRQTRWTGEMSAPIRPVPSWWPQFLPPAPRGPRTPHEWRAERAAYEANA